jgi:hypothetical protein
VNKNELIEERWHKDGTLIDNYDPEVHKNTVGKWFLHGSENKLRSEGLINELGGKIFVSKSIRDDISIQNGTQRPRAQNSYLYFVLGHKYFCLEVSFQALPISIFISRENGEITPEEEKEVEAKNKRYVILKLPHHGLSSYKNKTKISHALITLCPQAEFKIEDYESKNGTTVSPVTIKEADRIRECLEILGETNFTDNKKSINFANLEQIEIKGLETMQMPSVVKLGENVKLLIY